MIINGKLKDINPRFATSISNSFKTEKYSNKSGKNYLILFWNLFFCTIYYSLNSIDWIFT